MPSDEQIQNDAGAAAGAARQGSGLAALRDAFPTRPLTLAAPLARWRNWIFGLLCLAMPVGLGWWAATSLGPAILDDYALRGAAQPVDGTVRGRCQTHWGLFQSCDVTIAAGLAKGGGAAERNVHYFFVDPHVGSYSVQILAAWDRPGVLTTDLGQENLTNRAITLAGMLAIAIGVGLSGLVLIGRSGRERKAMRAMSGRPLQPVPVAVQRGKEGWAVTPLAGSGTSRWGLPAKAEPFWLDRARGIALGVSTPGAPVFPLDRELGWVDLTPEERARLQALAD